MYVHENLPTVAQMQLSFDKIASLAQHTRRKG
jgi:hypothetical protein